MTDAPTTPQHGETVRVKNLGSTTVMFVYNKGKYPVPPHGEAAVPVAAAKRSLGNWDAVDEPEVNIMPRTKEQERLATKYGLCGEPFYSDDPRETVAGTDELRGNGKPVVEAQSYDPTVLIDGRKQYRHPKLPNVEVYDLAGNRVITVLDDPDRTIQTGQVEREHRRDETAMLKAQLETLKQQQQQLIEGMAHINPTLAAELATTANSPIRGDLPSLHDDAPDSAGEVTPDPIDREDAMAIMDQELGIQSKDDDTDDTDTDDDIEWVDADYDDEDDDA